VSPCSLELLISHGTTQQHQPAYQPQKPSAKLLTPYLCYEYLFRNIPVTFGLNQNRPISSDAPYDANEHPGPGKPSELYRCCSVLNIRVFIVLQPREIQSRCSKDKPNDKQNSYDMMFRLQKKTQESVGTSNRESLVQAVESYRL